MYLVSLSAPLFVLGTQNHSHPSISVSANNSQRKKLWAEREQYGNDREKESFTGFSSIVPHKVSCSSFRQQHHAVVSQIDQASTKKSPPYQGKYIVIQIYSLFTFCLCRLAIVWLLWPSFFIASAINVLCKLGPRPIWSSSRQGLPLAPSVRVLLHLLQETYPSYFFHLQSP